MIFFLVCNNLLIRLGRRNGGGGVRCHSEHLLPDPVPVRGDGRAPCSPSSPPIRASTTGRECGTRCVPALRRDSTVGGALIVLVELWPAECACCSASPVRHRRRWRASPRCGSTARGAVRRHQYPAVQLLSGLRERKAVVPAGDAARRGAAHPADVRVLRLWPAALLAAVPWTEAGSLAVFLLLASAAAIRKSGAAGGAHFPADDPQQRGG